MGKSSPGQTNFSAGELSPLLYGRVDSDRYKTGLKTCKNYVPSIQGPLIRRTGTKFISEVREPTRKTRLIPFQFNTEQAYILEFGHLYIRFYKDEANIANPTGQAITGATNANPVVITSASHGRVDGDHVILQGVGGMTEINNREFEVANKTANTFELQDSSGNNIDGTGYGTYTSGGTIDNFTDIVSPYDETDLFELSFTQSADTLYIAHKDYQPRTLTRSSHTAWTLALINFLDGPWLTKNIKTVPPGATTLNPDVFGVGFATITVTASATAGINGGSGFLATDVGRHVRIAAADAGPWNDLKITAVNSTTEFEAQEQTGVGLNDTAATANWRLGRWSDTTEWPGVVTFHNDRTVWSGADSNPSRLDFSRVGDYLTFSPDSNPTETVTDSHAIDVSLNSAEVNVVRWLVSDEKGLLVGTAGAEWIVRAPTNTSVLSPTNIEAVRVSGWGSSDIRPAQAGSAVLFLQQAKRKLREFQFFFDVDGFRSSDLTVLAEHLTTGGIDELAYQKEPQSIVWAVRNDGQLLGMTYERDLESVRAGWHRHVLGGVSDVAGSAPVVESIAVIPSVDLTGETLWLVVKRYVNGREVRYIEVVTAPFEEATKQRDAMYLDSLLTLDAPVTISGATAANPVVVTAIAHGFSNSDTVIIDDVVGMTQINNSVGTAPTYGTGFTVANKTADTFELSGVNGTAYSAYVSGGKVRKKVTSITGLHHMEGETIGVIGDGLSQADVTVSDGAVTIATAAGVVHLGYAYDSDCETLRQEAGAADGVALGKNRRITQVALLVHRSLGLKIGPDTDNLDAIQLASEDDAATATATVVYDGIVRENFEGDYDYDGHIFIRQDNPYPSTILAISPVD